MASIFIITIIYIYVHSHTFPHICAHATHSALVTRVSNGLITICHTLFHRASSHKHKHTLTHFVRMKRTNMLLSKRECAHNSKSPNAWRRQWRRRQWRLPRVCHHTMPSSQHIPTDQPPKRQKWNGTVNVRRDCFASLHGQAFMGRPYALDTIYTIVYAPMCCSWALI